MPLKITIRPFEKRDVAKKVEWINDPRNNRFLHYDLPLEYDKTVQWLERNAGRTDRVDDVIEADGVPVGLIGLLSIDRKNGKAEFYISMGENDYKGRGVATRASGLMLEYAFRTLRLRKVYLYTEKDNLSAQKLFERLGFRQEGLLRSDVLSRTGYADRYAYGLTRFSWLRKSDRTPLYELESFEGNRIFIKREDMIPYSFGGNKARKAALFFREIDSGDYDTVVTYGSGHSNHCRVVANMAAARGMKCLLIGPEESSDETSNSRLCRLFGAEQTFVPVKEVHDTIENTLASLREAGKKPYFIPGGGHGDIGTEAYVECYDEIRSFEEENRVFFDRIFLASGTGTTQAGLVAGMLMDGDRRRVEGISIARPNPRGRDVIRESVKSYLLSRGFEADEEEIDRAVIFRDGYIGEGYGKADPAVAACARRALSEYGIPLDLTYTGKAFYGMRETLRRENVRGETILFLHTGGTPLFFDDMKLF